MPAFVVLKSKTAENLITAAVTCNQYIVYKAFILLLHLLFLRAPVWTSCSSDLIVVWEHHRYEELSIHSVYHTKTFSVCIERRERERERARRWVEAQAVAGWIFTAAGTGLHCRDPSAWLHIPVDLQPEGLSRQWLHTDKNCRSAQIEERKYLLNQITFCCFLWTFPKYC